MSSAAPLIVPVRGRVYLAPLGAEDDAEMKYWLCVSNNQRNPHLDEFIAVRLTTTLKTYPTWVTLTSADQPFVGCVNCDDIGPIYRDQIVKDAGGLSRPTMLKVADALKAVLSIP